MIMCVFDVQLPFFLCVNAVRVLLFIPDDRHARYDSMTVQTLTHLLLTQNTITLL